MKYAVFCRNNRHCATYLKMQQISLLPKYMVFTTEWCSFKNLLNNYILQLDDAPPHFHRNIRELLNHLLQQRWIGRAANGDNHIHILYGTNLIIVWMCIM
jgi:hypothetical protein